MRKQTTLQLLTISFAFPFSFALITVLLSCASSMAQVNTDWVALYSSPFHLVDYGRKIKVDADGNVYVGGHSKIDDQGNSKVAILKYDAAGNLLWVYNNSNTADIMEDMTLDAEGNIYYAGERWEAGTSEWDLLTVKVNTEGDSVWTSIYDGDGFGLGWDYGMALTLDASGNVYTLGYGAAPSFNGYDYEIVKYDSNGNQQWEVNWSNPDNPGMQANYFNDAYRIAPDNNGALFVSGYAFNGTTDEITLLKYSADGDFMWQKSYDTKTNWPEIWDNRNFMKIDSANNIYLSGNVYDSTKHSDILLIKYDNNGTLLWSAAWNSPGNDSDYVSGDFYDEEGLTFDHQGNIFVSGTTTNPAVIFSENIITLKYSGDGDLLWENTFNGIGNDEDRPYSITSDNSGNAYICGTTANSSGIGVLDYITFKLDGVTGQQDWKETFNGADDFYDQAHSIAVDDHNNVYVTGYSGIGSDPFDFHAQIATIKYSQSSTGIANLNHDITATVFPNPAFENIVVRFNLAYPSDVVLYLTNELGEMAGNRMEKTLEPGMHDLSFDVRSLTNGVYHLVLIENGKIHQQNVCVIQN